MRVWMGAGFALAVLCACTGCLRPKASDASFAQAEYLVREQRYDEARELLKAFLIEHPTHSGAHYYLGRCYLGAKDFWLTLAEGEIVTGLDFFQQQGKHSSISRFPDTYFELICHVDIARLNCLQARAAMEKHLPPEVAYACITKAGEALANARAVSPDAGETAAAQAELEQTQTLLGKYMQGPAAPSAPNLPSRRGPAPSHVI